MDWPSPLQNITHITTHQKPIASHLHLLPVFVRNRMPFDAKASSCHLLTSAPQVQDTGPVTVKQPEQNGWVSWCPSSLWFQVEPVVVPHYIIRLHSTYFYVTMCVQFISICNNYNNLHGLRLWIFLFFFLLWVLIQFSSIGSHHARSCQQGWSGWGLHLPVFPVKGLHLSPCQTWQCMQRDLYINSTLIRP